MNQDLGYSTKTQVLGWQGSLDLIYTRCQDATVITKAQSQAPLKVQRPFYPEGKAVCHSVVLHTAGGMVGGDLLTQQVTLEAHTHALITSAAAAKVYRSQGQQTQQTIEIKLAADACLEWLPQETIIFNGAIYRQQIRVELAPGASWLGWEINRLGRSARGEKFLQGEWHSCTEIWQQGKPLWLDRQFLKAGEATVFGAHGLANQPIVASLVWLGKPVPPAIIAQARSCWQQNQFPGEAGVTRTLGQGLLCRYRGSSTTQVKTWFMEVWQLLRTNLLQRPVVKPRVWQL